VVVPQRGGAALSRERFERLAITLRSAVSFWSRSLRLRVLVLTLIFSSLAMVGIGLILQTQITQRLIDAKRIAAISEVDSARITVQNDLAGADPNRATLEQQLPTALDKLGRPTGRDNGGQGSVAGVFQPVIVALRATNINAGPVEDVPAELQARVAAGMLATQYTSIRQDGVENPALVVGTPAVTDTDTFGVYLIFPLTSEQRTVQVVQTTLLLGGAALALALALIAMLVASQVVRPVRRAAAVAERFAAGALDERMPVKGAIELTTMARSFNGMAEAIRAQIRQLEEFGRLQRRFTSDVSHELRTPVTTVRMAADLLHADRHEFPPHLARATELLVAELDRFEVLLGDLLEISRHDAGMAELNAEPIDIRSHVRGCVEAIRPLAVNVGVEIELTVPDEPVVADIDSRRFERIIRNLLGNAVDHAEGKPVQVQVGGDEQAVAVSVTDHGIGLKPGEAGLVFNRFWRADPSRQRQTGGTGLGLAISLEDARLHGGWLQASGLPGVGARFRLTLPRRSGALVTGSPLPLRIGTTSDSEDEFGPAAGQGSGVASDQSVGPRSGPTTFPIGDLAITVSDRSGKVE
jgi:two-component system sensor histidine kinase MtrB